MKVGIYILLLVPIYLLAWTLAYVLIMSSQGLDFSHYFDYLRLVWSGNAFEIPIFIFGLSLVFFFPLAGVAAFLMWRRCRKGERR